MRPETFNITPEDGARSSNSRNLHIDDISSSEQEFSTIESNQHRTPVDAYDDQGSHQIVRRLTEDLDGERIMLELNEAKKLYTEAKKLHQLGNYFDAIEKLNDAIDTFQTQEHPSENLRTTLPEVYGFLKEAYLLSASCYCLMG